MDDNDAYKHVWSRDFITRQIGEESQSIPGFWDATDLEMEVPSKFKFQMSLIEIQGGVDLNEWDFGPHLEPIHGLNGDFVLDVAQLMEPRKNVHFESTLIRLQRIYNI